VSIELVGPAPVRLYPGNELAPAAMPLQTW